MSWADRQISEEVYHCNKCKQESYHWEWGAKGMHVNGYEQTTLLKSKCKTCGYVDTFFDTSCLDSAEDFW